MAFKHSPEILALIDEQYEKLLDDAYNTDGMISGFCEFNAEGFMLWCAEKGIDNDYACDHEMSYCESNDSEFAEYALRWKK